jgi:lipoprotein-releasing system permease protein
MSPFNLKRYLPSSAYIAYQYLLSSGGVKYFSWITLLSVAGISIGVAAMICVLAVINGFQKELRDRFLAANAHVLIFQYPHGIDRIEKLATTVNDHYFSEITGTAPFVHAETMASNGTLMQTILVRGISPKERQNVQDITKIVRPVSSLQILDQRQIGAANEYDEAPPIILGTGLASVLNAKIGEKVRLVRQHESEPSGMMSPFTVVGVYDSGLKHYDNKIGLVSIKDSQAHFDLGQKVHGLEIGLKRPDDSPEIARRMSDEFIYTVKEWQSFNKQMFESLEMERAMIGLIVALVAFVASFNILTTLFISVTHRQKAISILKSLGAPNGFIQRIFVVQGLFIGIAGSLIGSVLALIISWLLERYEFLSYQIYTCSLDYQLSMTLRYI